MDELTWDELYKLYKKEDGQNPQNIPELITEIIKNNNGRLPLYATAFTATLEGKFGKKMSATDKKKYGKTGTRSYLKTIGWEKIAGYHKKYFKKTIDQVTLIARLDIVYGTGDPRPVFFITEEEKLNKEIIINLLNHINKNKKAQNLFF